VASLTNQVELALSHTRR